MERSVFCEKRIVYCSHLTYCSDLCFYKTQIKQYVSIAQPRTGFFVSDSMITLRAPLDFIPSLLRHHAYSSVEYSSRHMVYLPPPHTEDTDLQDVDPWQGTTGRVAMVPAWTYIPAAQSGRYTAPNGRESPDGIYRTCVECSTLTIPLWRRGPTGQISCNACGSKLKFLKEPGPLDSLNVHQGVLVKLRSRPSRLG